MEMNEAPITMGDHGHKNVRPDTLRLLGKQASELYHRDGVPMTEAVVSVLSDQEGLGQEHVRRVVEFANGYAFEEQFKKTGGDHRVINFDDGPADPAAAMKELRTGATPAVSSAPRPSTVSDRDAFIPGEDGIKAIFSGAEKTASASYESARPMGSVEDTYFQLRDLESTLLSQLTTMDVAYQDSAEQMYKEARQVILSGHSAVDVGSVVSVAAPSADMAKLALRHIHQRVERDGDLPIVPMDKVAESRVVNSKHPLYKASVEFMKLAFDRFRCLSAVENVQTQLNSVKQQLKG